MRATNLNLRKMGISYKLVDSGGGNVDMSQVLTLNSVAAWLWEQASKGEFTAETLADALCAKYEVEPDVALADVKEQLAQWKEYGIVLD